MSDRVLLVRDVMVIGVPVCRGDEACGAVAERLAAQGARGDVVVVLDDDGMACGWARRGRLQAAAPGAPARSVMDECIPEFPPDIPAAAAAALLRDQGLEYGFLMHNWPGERRPAAMIARRTIEERLARPA
jgi:hypothetical protein